jgi:hypothetical protein
MLLQVAFYGINENDALHMVIRPTDMDEPAAAEAPSVPPLPLPTTNNNNNNNMNMGGMGGAQTQTQIFQSAQGPVVVHHVVPDGPNVNINQVHSFSLLYRLLIYSSIP